MSLEDFQLIDNEPIDNSIVKRDFTKVYHQSGANLNVLNKTLSLYLGKITTIIRLEMAISNLI